MIEIRDATAADRDVLTRLAGRDSARVPAGRLVVGLACGELLAALSLETGEAIADPFAPTERLVATLRAWAAPEATPPGGRLRLAPAARRRRPALRPEPSAAR